MKYLIDPCDAFKMGDLIYGLKHSRINLVHSEQTYSLLTQNFKKYGYQDFYIDFFEPESVFDEQTAAPPLSMQESFSESAAKHPKYRSILNPLTTIEERSLCLSTAIGRKVKAGLNWAAESNRRVHFVLDDIKMEEVVNKELRDLGDGFGERKPHIGEELRWIYRNRTNPMVEETVLFWKDGMRSKAPWDYDKDLWSTYKPKHVYSAASGEAENLSPSRNTLVCPVYLFAMLET